MRPEQRIVIVGGGPAALSTARSYREAGGRASIDAHRAEPHLPYHRPPLTKEFLRGELDARRPAARERGAGSPHTRCPLRRGRPRGRARSRRARRVELEGGQELALRRLRARHRLGARSARRCRAPTIPACTPSARVDDALRLRGAAQRGAPRGGRRRRLHRLRGGRLAGAARRSTSTLVAPEELPQAAPPGRAGRRAHHRAAVRGGRRGAPRRRGRAHRAAAGACAWPAARSSPPTSSCSATGVAPRGELAAGAGLDVEDGAVLVDASMRSSDAGRARRRRRRRAPSTPRAGRRLRVEHWGDALAQGEVAGPHARRRGRARGRRARASGRRSATTRSSTRRGATASTRRASRPTDDAHLVVRYRATAGTVGVLTLGDDDDYEAARRSAGGRAR